MDNVLENSIKEIEAKYEGTEQRSVYAEGVRDAIEAVRGFLTISSHLSKDVRISDLRGYLNRISI
jgi:hypothetical protein